VSVRSRVAFASGAAGAVGAALLLSGRFEGSVVLALVLAFSIRTAAFASLVDGGPILASGALRGLRARTWLAPAWVLVAAASIARSGSVALDDVRGVNAVAGPALTHGPALTVAGSWLAFAGAVLALIVWHALGAETAGGPTTRGHVVPPQPVKRLEVAGVLAESALIVTLFAGPQIVSGVDAAWWVGGIAALLAVAWLARRATVPAAAMRPALPAALAAAGLALVLVGGPP
jgi:hypothetical protein